MRTKNAARITAAESEHMRRVKEAGCVCCGVGGFVEAHHIVQGAHFLTVALCDFCHRGPRGIHGDQSILRLAFKAAGERGELLALQETLRRVYG